MLQMGIEHVLWLFLYPVIDNQYLYPMPCNNCTQQPIFASVHPKQNSMNNTGRAYNSIKSIPALGLLSWCAFYNRENTGVKEKQRKNYTCTCTQTKSNKHWETERWRHKHIRSQAIASIEKGRGERRREKRKRRKMRKYTSTDFIIQIYTHEPQMIAVHTMYNSWANV